MAWAELKTPEDFHRYTRELSTRRVEDDSRIKAWRVAKRITWLLLLAGSFLFYYLLEKMQEALSLL